MSTFTSNNARTAEVSLYVARLVSALGGHSVSIVFAQLVDKFIGDDGTAAGERLKPVNRLGLFHRWGFRHRRQSASGQLGYHLADGFLLALGSLPCGLKHVVVDI